MPFSYPSEERGERGRKEGEGRQEEESGEREKREERGGGGGRRGGLGNEERKVSYIYTNMTSHDVT